MKNVMDVVVPQMDPFANVKDGMIRMTLVLPGKGPFVVVLTPEQHASLLADFLRVAAVITRPEQD